MAELFERDGEMWIRENNGVEHLAGDLPEPISPQPTDAERIAQLEAIIDTLLTGGVTP